jgi:hypothetical protein
VFGFLAFGKEIEKNIKKCPKTFEIIKNISKNYEITTGFYSN